MRNEGVCTIPKAYKGISISASGLKMTKYILCVLTVCAVNGSHGLICVIYSCIQNLGPMDGAYMNISRKTTC